MRIFVVKHRWVCSLFVFTPPALSPLLLFYLASQGFTQFANPWSRFVPVKKKGVFSATVACLGVRLDFCEAPRDNLECNFLWIGVIWIELNLLVNKVLVSMLHFVQLSSQKTIFEAQTKSFYKLNCPYALLQNPTGFGTICPFNKMVGRCLVCIRCRCW